MTHVRYASLLLPCNVPVILDHPYWFERGSHGVQERGAKPDLLVVHWTGTERGLPSFFRSAALAKRSMHFFVDYAGTIWQLADLSQTCAHTGIVDPRSIGIACQSRGFALGKDVPERTRARLERRAPRGIYRDRIRHTAQSFCMLTATQLDAVEALRATLVKAKLISRAVPRDAGGRVARRTLAPWEIARFRGTLGSYHLSEAEWGPGPQLFEELVGE